MTDAALSGDPRISGEAGVLPVVAVPRRGPPGWTIALGIAALALLLFIVLDARRRALSAPAVRPRASELRAAPASPPPLYIPPAPLAYVQPPPAIPVRTTVPPPAPVVPVRPAAPAPVSPAIPNIYLPPAPAPAAPARASGDSALVIDTTQGPATAATKDGAEPADAPASSALSASTGRAGAGVFANRATTVPQGTLIPAILETALDSSRPGPARALVSRDIRGFDGSRILIPRGSRLIGEYRADAETGQNRMLVSWTRLIRPDGATIAIGSPGADPLGRVGIRARVNSHFFERFAGALLQSSLNIGVNLASRSTGSPLVVALPGAAQNAGTQITSSRDIRPTLTVRAASRISIFVARDLDFTGIDRK